MSTFLCDTNIWLALTFENHEHARAATRWLNSVQEPRSIWFCRTTQHSFLRLITSTAVVAPYGFPPLTNTQAWATYDAFIRDNRIVLATDEPPNLDKRWREFAERSTASPKLWMDAYLAAFALAAGHRFVTTDRAFRQFRELDLLVLEETPSS